MDWKSDPAVQAAQAAQDSEQPLRRPTVRERFPASWVGEPCYETERLRREQAEAERDAARAEIEQLEDDLLDSMRAISLGRERMQEAEAALDRLHSWAG